MFTFQQSDAADSDEVDSDFEGKLEQVELLPEDVDKGKLAQVVPIQTCSFPVGAGKPRSIAFMGSVSKARQLESKIS